ncbi:MAG TPA: hypothetical protein VIV11_18790 [Kofleriaceae bacterium]
MEATLIAIILTLGGGIIGYFAHNTWFGSDARRTRRVLRRTRVTPIADLSDGMLVCVVGTVVAEGELAQALMSRKPCVAFETVVQVFGNLDMTVPARVDVTRKLIPFIIVDASGRARVDAAEAALANRPIMKSERFEERVIENGARVRIVGSCVLDPTMQANAEHAYREGAYKATITGTSKYPLLIDLED